MSVTYRVWTYADIRLKSTKRSADKNLWSTSGRAVNASQPKSKSKPSRGSPVSP